MAHLLFDEHDRRPTLNEQEPERMPQVVELDLPDAGFRQNRDKVPMIQIIWVKDASIRGLKYQML